MDFSTKMIDCSIFENLQTKIDEEAAVRDVRYLIDQRLNRPRSSFQPEIFFFFSDALVWLRVGDTRNRSDTCEKRFGST